MKITSRLKILDQIYSIYDRFAASLDLAYVACGRLDGYWERGLEAWDLSAGALLVALPVMASAIRAP